MANLGRYAWRIVAVYGVVIYIRRDPNYPENIVKSLNGIHLFIGIFADVENNPIFNTDQCFENRIN